MASSNAAPDPHDADDAATAPPSRPRTPSVYIAPRKMGTRAVSESKTRGRVGFWLALCLLTLASAGLAVFGL